MAINFRATISTSDDIDLMRCSQCQDENCELRLYSFEYDKEQIITNWFKAENDVQIYLLCKICLSKQLIQEKILESELFQCQNQYQVLQNQNQRVKERMEQLMGNSDAQDFSSELNIPKTTQLLMCLVNFTQEMKELYEDDKITELHSFYNIKSTGDFVYEELKKILKDKIYQKLGSLQKYIVKDVDNCKKSVKRLENIQQEFLKQYEKDIQFGTITVNQFKNYVQIEQKNKNIEEKKKALDKAQLIKDMTVKSLV